MAQMMAMMGYIWWGIVGEKSSIVPKVMQRRASDSSVPYMNDTLYFNFGFGFFVLIFG